MINIGEYHDMVIARIAGPGAYLSEISEAGESPDTGRESGSRFSGRHNRGASDEILLPGRQIPEGAKAGDTVRVFVYRDSSDRLIATTAQPLIVLGEVKRLQVKQKTKIGAFLDWGLEKDLLLPFREQTGDFSEGDTVLAALYVDKSGRLAGTMKIYPYLKQNSPYQTGDSVQGTVYQTAENFGVFVAVDDIYSGMIPKKDAQKGFRVGESLTLRVTGVKEDGKLDLSVRDKAYLEIGTDAEAVLEKILGDFGGELPFDDRAEPARIREVFGLSKAAFKRAVGHLYKERKVVLSDGRIRAAENADIIRRGGKHHG